MLRGNAPAKIDDKGRLKVPNAFRAVIQKDHGSELFVTSLTGQSVRIYPMPVWAELERRLAQVPSTNPARQRFLDRVNFYGQVAELDTQGRVVIQPRLRDSAQITGDVDVLGGKTGFISKAGYCLATLLQLPQGGPQIAVVVLGARSNAGRFWETRHLFNWFASKAQDLISTDLQAAPAVN